MGTYPQPSHNIAFHDTKRPIIIIDPSRPNVFAYTVKVQTWMERVSTPSLVLSACFLLHSFRQLLISVAKPFTGPTSEVGGHSYSPQPPSLMVPACFSCSYSF